MVQTLLYSLLMGLNNNPMDVSKLQENWVRPDTCGPYQRMVMWHAFIESSPQG